MAKLTANGVTIEGTAEELAVLMAQMTAKTDVVEDAVTPLKVGDYARVVGGSTEIQNLAEGDIVEIRETAGFYDFKVFRVTDDEDELFNRGDLVRATDEEVSAFKVQAEVDAIERKRTAVFTDAGRKPNEYREGDIVEFTDDYTAIGVVEDIGGGRDESDLLGVRSSRVESSYQAPKVRDVKPIVFVENRLDSN